MPAIAKSHASETRREPGRFARARAAASRRFARPAGAAAALAMAAFAPGAAFAEGAFAGMDGQWTGGGSVILASGTKESLRCRAQYLVKNEDNNVQQALRCASDSYKFELNAYIDQKNGAISGSWNELTNQVSGRINGSFADGRIDARVAGTGFAAAIVVSTRGDKQSVSIRPEDTDVREVTIELRRR